MHDPVQPAGRGAPFEATPAAEARQRRRLLTALIRSPRFRRRLLMLLSIAAIFIGVLLAALVRSTTLLPLDLLVSRDLQAAPQPWLRPLMLAISAPGYQPWSSLAVAAGALLVGVLLGWRDSAYLLVITVAQGLANLTVKALIGRPRPASELVDVLVPQHGASFPSGHVMFYTVFFGFLGFLAGTRLPRSPGRVALVGLCVALMALIGPSRIYLGAHWLSDVVAAYLLGVVMLALAIELYLARVAPRRLSEQGGLVGAADRSHTT